MSVRVLITGFEPFGGDTANASGQAVLRLARRFDDPDLELVHAVIPVSFLGGPEALRRLIAEHDPDVVVAVGEAGGRSAVTPEQWAVNEQVARIPDNDGAQPSGPIDTRPQRLASRLDVDALVAAVLQAGIPAESSQDAGAFVCNAVFRAALTGFDGPAGFVHVPAVRDCGAATVGAETDAKAPVQSGLTFDDLATALEAIVRASVVSHGF